MKKTILILASFLVSTFSFASGNFVTYSINGEAYEGYYIGASANAPLVLLIHDWDGLTNYEVKRAKMLADLGYSVFAADLFGKGVRPTEVKDKRQHTGELYKNRTKMRDLMNGALAKAKSQGGNTQNTVAMGYCFGGAAVLEYARSGVDLKAFVTFHGGLATPDGQNYKGTKGKIAIFHGTADKAISMQQFADLAVTLEKEKVHHEMITYSGAPHAFTVYGSRNYRKEADQKSWNRFLAILKGVTK